MAMMTTNAAANLVDDCYETCSDHLPPKLEEIVKQIQLDAMREGMRRAQQVIFDTESPYNMDAQRIATSINDAIDSLTEQDLQQ